MSISINNKLRMILKVESEMESPIPLHINTVYICRKVFENEDIIIFIFPIWLGNSLIICFFFFLSLASPSIPAGQTPLQLTYNFLELSKKLVCQDQMNWRDQKLKPLVKQIKCQFCLMPRIAHLLICDTLMDSRVIY